MTVCGRGRPGTRAVVLLPWVPEVTRRAGLGCGAATITGPRLSGLLSGAAVWPMPGVDSSARTPNGATDVHSRWGRVTRECVTGTFGATRRATSPRAD